MLLAVVCSFSVQGQTASQSAGQDLRESRLALVIGNSNYRNSPLANPVNDARLMEVALKQAGFQVIKAENASLRETRRLVRDFGDKLKQLGGVGLFYFAGHGVQVRGENYLVSVDSDIRNEDEVAEDALNAQLVLEKMQSAGNRVNLVILDACRNNPFAVRSRSSSAGLATMNAPSGSMVAYSTAPGSVASDGSGQNGLYTEHLARVISQVGLPVEEVFKQVRTLVRRDSNGQQTPWENTALEGQFFFRPPPTEVAIIPPTQQTAPRPQGLDPTTLELSFWETVKNSGSIEELQSYTARFPMGVFADVARARIASLRSKNQAPATAAAAASPATAAAPPPAQNEGAAATKVQEPAASAPAPTQAVAPAAPSPAPVAASSAVPVAPAAVAASVTPTVTVASATKAGVLGSVASLLGRPAGAAARPQAVAPTVAPPAEPVVQPEPAAAQPAAASTPAPVPAAAPAAESAPVAEREIVAGTTRFIGRFAPDADGRTWSGSGKVIWANGDTFEGKLVAGKRQGIGKFSWRDGQYSGEWVDDKAQGKGTLDFSNGNHFDGTVLDGLPNGEGVMKYASGDIYSGQFTSGLPNGRGVFEWRNGQRYEGDWKMDRPQGVGTLRFANGNQYEGEVADGVPNGQGSMRYASGDGYKGTFRNGVPDGRGVFTWKNGDQYSGQWKAGAKDGDGVFAWGNGDRWEGVFRNDQQTDAGKLIRKTQ